MKNAAASVSMPSASMAKRFMHASTLLISSTALRPSRFIADSSRSLQRRSRQRFTPTRRFASTSVVSSPTWSDVPGTAGVSMFKEQLPDLAIVDVLLPRTNGFEVCFEIKRTAHGKKTPVFLMSAVYKDLERAEVYAKNDLQAQAYFVKPFDLAQLLRRVQLFIGEA